MEHNTPVRQKILAVSGVKNSGKTTLLEKLIPALAQRGIRTAVIKHDGHGFAADREGTDTWRMLRAGAAGAAIYDSGKFQAVKYAPVTEAELIALYPEAELILLEGFKWTGYPKIEVWRRDNSPAPVCDSASLLALVTDGESPFPGVLVLGPEDTEGLAELVCRFLREEKQEE
ncbi:MAG: molybdopterin-guanine dinucleotide biosynthesis protein B [Oscillospiraceae bacterium]|nr:molybdopterin-guanine dinucleotide biosynthesis protein B [Oscillospiraceae bacterium]